jgi:hypothetical protein
MLCINTKSKLLDGSRFRFDGDSFWFKDYSEMVDSYKEFHPGLKKMAWSDATHALGGHNTPACFSPYCVVRGRLMSSGCVSTVTSVYRFRRWIVGVSSSAIGRFGRVR